MWTSPLRKIKAAVINCNGVTYGHGEPRYTTVEVGGNHAAFQEPISPLSQLLEYPIRLMCLETALSEVPEDLDHLQYMRNEHAESLMRQLNSTDASLDLASSKWQSPPGNVLAVSANGEDLSVVLLEIMVDFATTRVRAVLSGEPCSSGREFSPTQFYRFMQEHEWRKDLDGPIYNISWCKWQSHYRDLVYGRREEDGAAAQTGDEAEEEPLEPLRPVGEECVCS